MIIGIDARLYGAKHSGIGRYIKELILNLLKIDRQNQYVFFVYNNKDKQEILTDIQSACDGKNISYVIAPFRWYSLKEQILMPSVIKKTKVDLMHFPHFNAPLTYNDSYIVTIHDLIIHHFPNERATTLPRWLYRLKLIGYKKVMKHAVMKAKTIITPSEFTKKNILKFYEVNTDKIKVIYEGVADLSLKFKVKSSKLQLKVKSYGNYLLYVGTAYPHKNLEKFIEAFALLRQKYNLTNLKLVLVGKKDYFYNQLQKKIISQYPNIPISNIIFYNQASDSELAELYQNGKLFVFPSLREGFGLPPLEAMSFGLPVVASQTASISEVCGGSAIYFDPTDHADIANKIWSVYQDSVLQSKLRTKGFDQIKKYSWAKMAQETLGIYKNFTKLH